MRIHLIVFSILGVFFLNCSSSGSTPNSPNIPPIVGSNWAIYASIAPSYDPLSMSLWLTNTTDPNFISSWTKETIYNATSQSFFSGIDPNIWSTGITTLKGSAFTGGLPTIKSYTCYDRVRKDSFGRAINSNCFIDTNNNNAFTCNLLYAIQAGAASKACVITTPGNLTTPAQFSACTAQDVTLGTVGCYPDLTGPNPATRHIKGFYCTGWQTTTYDLTKVNMVLNNLRNGGTPYGCMSPGTTMTANTAWGGLGIGSSCTAEDPGIIDVGAWIPNPVYLDPVVTYGNPFTDDNVSGVSPVILGSASSDQFKIWNSFINFCSTQAGFCKLPAGTSRPGLAHVFGRAGPVALTNYVSLIKAKAPNDYSWQYDDGPALIQCDQASTKLVVYFCSTTPALTSFPSTPAAYPSGYASRLAIVNNCSEDIWVQQKTVTKVLPNIVPTAVNDGSCVPKSSTDLSCDFLVHLTPGANHIYNIPVTGIQSLNMWAKSGCQTDGYHCVSGETIDNPSRPNYDSKCPDTALKNGTVCATNLGPQPDIETKIEGTFGCTATDRTTCTKTQNGSTLSGSTFVDTSFVDGFTRTVGVQIFKDGSEVSASCRNHDAPTLTVSDCPTAADLSTRPNG